MGAQRALRAAFVVIVGLSGCVSFDTVRCGDGRICQAGSRCDDHGGCIVPAQIDACEGAGLADGADCTIDGASGTCSHGGCIAWVCGDHVRNGAEECEDADLGGKTCLDLGWNNSTGLACNADCTFNQDGCTGGCGDSIKDETEQCDGAIEAGTDCRTLGFYDADGLTCSPYCRYDVQACKGFCGDSIVNGPEQCDRVAPAGESCLDYSFDRGRLGCTLCAPGFGGCTKLGWQHESSPTSLTLRAIWGSDANDFFVVGNGGTILHHVSGQLAQVASVPTSQNLNAVWGASANDVFAAGGGGVVLHYDGTAFTSMTTTTSAALTGLWGTSATNVYAVGVAGTLLHYDGNGWTSSTLGSATLRAVWGSSANDIYAVGDAKTVFHFDGAQWSASSVLPGTFDVDLFAVWGSGPTDVFFAGKNRSNQPIVLHYDGSWTTGYTSTDTGVLAATWGSGPTDVIYAGTTTLHGDGMELSPLLAPPGLGATDQLWGLWGTPGGTVWVVGDSGYVAHWNGGGWTQPPTLTATKLRAVASLGSSDAYAVGSATAGASLHYDGAWSSLTVPVSNGDVLRSVWMGTSSFGVAVGANSNNGVVYHYGGSSWAAPCAAATTGRSAVWGTSASDVWAVGDADGSNMKAISHWDGGCWSNTSFVAPSGVLRLFAIAGSSATDIFAAGQRSAVPATAAMFHSSGATWSEMPLPLPDPAVAKPLTRIDGLWASAANDVFAVGDGIVHYNGSTWSNMTGPAQSLRAVAGTGPRNVFAVGDNARLLHYDGISWTPMRVPTSLSSAFFRGVSATARSVIVVGEVGADGFAQRLSFARAPSETNCRDAWDDDGDGLPDCADDDCAADAYCTAGGACPTINATPMVCGGMLLGSTVGLTPSRDYYTCDPDPETGPEAMYAFVPAASGQVTVTLSDFGGADLDLVAVGAMQNTAACDPDLSCLGASSTSGASETITFTATAGRPYYFIVDGRNGASGSFALQVTCP